MKRSVFSTSLLCIAVLVAPAGHLGAQGTISKKHPTPTSVSKRRVLTNRELVERASASLVMVEAQGADGTPIATGSGFFFFRGGTKVLTNLHVLKWAHQVVVKSLVDQTRYAVDSVHAADLARDLCLLEVNSPAFPVLVPAPQYDTQVGDDVLVAGNPKGLEGTFSKGIVSAIRAGSDRIQIDAPISPGSSGGPVLNRYGEVIGVATSSLTSGQALNFAVPVFQGMELMVWNWYVYPFSKLAVSDIELEGLKGRVKAVDTYSFDLDVSKDNPTHWVETPKDSIVRLSFNEDGMLTERLSTYHGRRGREERFQYSEFSIPKMSYQYFRTKDGPQEGTSDFSVKEGATHRNRSVHFDETVWYAGSEEVRRSREVSSTKQSYWFTTYDRRGRTVVDEEFGISYDNVRREDRWVYTYDDNGWIASQRRYSLDDELLTDWSYTYEVDLQRNWLVQRAFLRVLKTGERFPASVERRKITYY
jgi:serine protease Do